MNAEGSLQMLLAGMLAINLLSLSVVTAQPGGTTTPCPKGNGQVVRLVSKTSTEYTVFFSGCPFYSPYNQTTPNTPTFQNKTVTFRITPVLSSTVTYVGIYASGTTSNSQKIMSTIGYTVTGIAMFSDADATGSDAYVNEGHTFDGCRGHAEMNGLYHYHSEPGSGCVYNETAGTHSPLLGIMYDSIPIYGALGDNGVPPTNLDECGGHTDTTYPFYHYHTTYNLKSPYIVKCLRGCIFNANGNPSIQQYNLVKTDATCVKAATQYDYSSFVNPLLSSSPVTTSSPPPPPSSAAACRWHAWLAAVLLVVCTLATQGFRTA